jgi:hypothetical protein
LFGGFKGRRGYFEIVFDNEDNRGGKIEDRFSNKVGGVFDLEGFICKGFI